MAYTWEEVMLGIDVRNEMAAKNREAQDIQDEADREGELQSAWSLGLSLLGAAVFGPVGYFAGKQLGKWGVDAAINWEDDAVDPGKFYASDTRKWNKELEDIAKDVNQAQVVGSIIDLGTMWMQAGGLEEGFDPTSLNEWTSFGTGDDAWTVFGRGEAGTPGFQEGVSEMADATSFIDVPGTPASANFTQGLFDADQPGLLNALKAGGQRLFTAGQQEQAASNVGTTLTSLYSQYEDQRDNTV